MATFTLNAKQFDRFLQGCKPKGYQFAMTSSTGAGTDLGMSFDVDNEAFQAYTPPFGKYVRNIVGGSHSHTAKTGYKRVTVTGDGHTYQFIPGLEAMPYVQGSSGANHTLLPKQTGGTPSAASDGSGLAITHVFIPTIVDTTAFINYFRDFFQYPTKYDHPASWLYPFGRLPDTLPIYFNDFYHIRTPLND